MRIRRSALAALPIVAIVLVGLGLAALAPLAAAAPPAAGAPPTAGVPSLAPMLQGVLPGVVSIAVRGHVTTQPNPLFSDPEFRRYFNLPDNAQPPTQEFQAAGSGVIVDARNGYVITNNHVVENADEITVVLGDRRRLTARKIGTDPATDVAVIQIPADNLAALPLGDSSTLRIGDYVVAIGNPFGLGQTVTMGIVSALGRTGLGIEGYEDFIQTDASINPGNSGGALVDLDGRLVGINSAIIGPSGGNVGIGFAIPINMARSVMDELIAHGSIQHGQLGVTIEDVTADLAKTLKLPEAAGAVVREVVAGSAADKAGIKVDDVLVSIDGGAVVDGAELRNRIGLRKVGDKLKVTVLRAGARQDFEVVLQAAKAVQ